MKTTLTLSAVLFTLTLAPAAFADGAQEQKEAEAAPVVAATPSPEASSDIASITRTVLEGLDLDLRAELLTSLREGALGLLQAATPALVGTTLDAARELTAR